MFKKNHSYPVKCSRNTSFYYRRLSQTTLPVCVRCFCPIDTGEDTVEEKEASHFFRLWKVATRNGTRSLATWVSHVLIFKVKIVYLNRLFTSSSSLSFFFFQKELRGSLGCIIFSLPLFFFPTSLYLCLSSLSLSAREQNNDKLIFEKNNKLWKSSYISFCYCFICFKRWDSRCKLSFSQ